MSTWILSKRKALKLSQSEVAKVLGVSRPTYIKIESGERKISDTERGLLARVFALPESHVDASLDDARSLDTVAPRAIPVENVDKFKQTLLYVVSKVSNKPNVGQTALYKLLYFIDFDFYEKYEKQLIGATYIKNTFGPTPVSFAKVVRDLQTKGELVVVKSKYFGHDQTRYMTTKESDVSLLSGEELKHIDDEIARLASKSAKELSDFSHLDTPWRIAKDKEVLDYEYVFYRPQETSVREYEPL